MKKLYVTPALEVVSFSLKDVILSSDPEGRITETIGGGSGGPIDLEDDELG